MLLGTCSCQDEFLVEEEEVLIEHVCEMWLSVFVPCAKFKLKRVNRTIRLSRSLPQTRPNGSKSL